MTEPPSDLGVRRWPALQSQSRPDQGSSEVPFCSYASPKHSEWRRPTANASPEGVQSHSSFLARELGCGAVGPVHHVAERQVSSTTSRRPLIVAPKESSKALPPTLSPYVSVSGPRVTGETGLGPRVLCHSIVSAEANSAHSWDQIGGQPVAPAAARRACTGEDKVAGRGYTPVEQAHPDWNVKQDFTSKAGGEDECHRRAEQRAVVAASAGTYVTKEAELSHGFSVSTSRVGGESKLLSDLMTQERHLLGHFARQRKAVAPVLPSGGGQMPLCPAPEVWARAVSATGAPLVSLPDENSLQLPSASVSLLPSAVSLTDLKNSLTGRFPVPGETGQYGIVGTVNGGRESPAVYDANVSVLPYESTCSVGVAVPVCGNVVDSPFALDPPRRPQATGGPGPLPCRRQQKAVIVGCNYHVSHPYHLRGSANDAHLFAHACVQLLKFDPHNICLVTDSAPSTCYRGQRFSDGSFFGPSHDHLRPSTVGVDVEASLSSKSVSRPDGRCVPQGGDESATDGFTEFLRPRGRNKVSGSVTHPVVDIERIESEERFPLAEDLPTRHNILKALNWLVRNAGPDDFLIFYFSGHSVQMDNMAGWEGEGYEEGLVPCDFNVHDIENGDPSSLISVLHIRELLLSIPSTTQLTVFLDCSGGQTILDPAGSLTPFSFIKGVKQRGVWPVTDPTDKMHRAVYRKVVWTDPDMQKQLVRPRYLPGVEVQSIKGLADPLLQSVHAAGHPTYNAFCIAAARKELATETKAGGGGVTLLCLVPPEAAGAVQLGDEEMSENGLDVFRRVRSPDGIAREKAKCSSLLNSVQHTMLRDFLAQGCQAPRA
ncbi:ice family protease p20 domain-containing protein [Cystoisospora suis]|uniref:Ice family protease p20 domain-containing protein n=1 Tax=Cystoisospora suis TaxID=483139 RepID=A0A2C6JY06_9APIC|nr:ice family protease p20 domain-containing protein [Cystoisospora suis]